MSVSTDFAAFLKSQTSVTDLVGDRICQAPAHIDEEVPYIVFMRNGRSQETDLSGTKDNDHTFLDVECRGTSQGEAEAIGDAVYALLHAKAYTWGSRRVQGIFCSDQEDDYVHIPPGSTKFHGFVTTRVEIISE